MDILTLNNGQVANTGKDPVAPLINPVGPLPPTTSLSSADAAAAATSASKPGDGPLAVLVKSQQNNTLLFLALIMWAAWKLGR